MADDTARDPNDSARNAISLQTTIDTVPLVAVQRWTRQTEQLPCVHPTGIARNEFERRYFRAVLTDSYTLALAFERFH